ncbi:MAG: P-loop NTPase fold protein [Saprospiraceae bacterium]
MIIGLSGGSGSGKTSFINELRKSFNTNELGLISEDNYFKEIELQHVDQNGVVNFDIPEAIDHESLLKDLNRLLQNLPVSRLEYVFNNNSKERNEIRIEPAKIYILEGIFIFHNREIFDLLDLKVLIHAKDQLKIDRRIKRDQIERNYPIDDVLYRYKHHVMPAYKNYIQPYFDDMDIIVNNNAHFNRALDLFKSYLKDQIRS